MAGGLCSWSRVFLLWSTEKDVRKSCQPFFSSRSGTHDCEKITLKIFTIVKKEAWLVVRLKKRTDNFHRFCCTSSSMFGQGSAKTRYFLGMTVRLGRKRHSWVEKSKYGKFYVPETTDVLWSFLTSELNRKRTPKIDSRSTINVTKIYEDAPQVRWTVAWRLSEVSFCCSCICNHLFTRLAIVTIRSPKGARIAVVFQLSSQAWTHCWSIVYEFANSQF